MQHPLFQLAFGCNKTTPPWQAETMEDIDAVWAPCKAKKSCAQGMGEDPGHAGELVESWVGVLEGIVEQSESEVAGHEVASLQCT